MIKKIFLMTAFFLVLQACATPTVIIKQDYDFASVRSVRVGKFVSNTDYSNSGSVVQNAFIRHLLAKGYNVKAGHDTQSDVIIRGSVTTYVPDKKYLIRLPEENNFYNRNSRHAYTVIYASDITEISGSTMYDLGPALGLNEPNKIMASNATVGVYAYMEDSETGEIVWSDSYTYEGLDLSSTLEGAVKYVLRSLPVLNRNDGIIK
ncbi:MAG: hypothetical protein LBD46_03055 [Endomicrobium sp.]|jgi:hypothetical protein|nr:hypothetical protein [Endomicrobium sp.]